MELIEQEQEELIEKSWTEAWSSVNFKRKFLTAVILFAAVLLCYPYFFSFIQQRTTSTIINDPILDVLPSLNMSPYIFALIYTTIALGIFRCSQSPTLFLLFLWSSLFFSVSRIITITLVPLNPPAGLVPLVDPVLIAFYRHNQITKDLFYSGHTGSVFLMYLLLARKREKIYALVAAILVAVLLLIQHIHYTIDVLFAPLFVYFVYILAKKVTKISLENPLKKYSSLTNLQLLCLKLKEKIVFKT